MRLKTDHVKKNCSTKFIAETKKQKKYLHRNFILKQNKKIAIKYIQYLYIIDVCYICTHVFNSVPFVFVIY